MDAIDRCRICGKVLTRQAREETFVVPIPEEARLRRRKVRGIRRQVREDNMAIIEAEKQPERPPIEQKPIVKDAAIRLFGAVYGEHILEAVKYALENCTERERFVLYSRFGLDGQKAKTLEGVAKPLRVTRERIRQIERKALRKLQNPYRGLKLVFVERRFDYEG